MTGPLPVFLSRNTASAPRPLIAGSIPLKLTEHKISPKQKKYQINKMQCRNQNQLKGFTKDYKQGPSLFLNNPTPPNTRARTHEHIRFATLTTKAHNIESNWKLHKVYSDCNNKCKHKTQKTLPISCFHPK